MNLKMFQKAGCLLLLFCGALNVSAQNKYYSWDFSRCDIKDILYAVSLDSGISIVADDTVCGTADLKFAGSDFERAFDSFLKSARLYVEKNDSVWTVSKMLLRKAGGRYTIDACDLLPAVLVEKLSMGMDCVITFDALPAGEMSVHFKDLTESELFEGLARAFGSYEVVQNDTGIHFKKRVDVRNVEAVTGFANLTTEENGRLVVDLRDVLFSEVLDLMFEKMADINVYHYCFLADSDVRVKRTFFEGESVRDVLDKLCAQNGYGYNVVDGIFYFYSDANKKDILINGEHSWQKFFLKYTSVDVIFPIVYSRLGAVECMAVPDKDYFFANVTEAQALVVSNIIKEVDIKLQTYVVELKYLRPGEFVQQLPPSIDKNKIFTADDNSCVYFKGTEDEYNVLCEQLELFDKPVKRITYDLLILQYDEGKQNQWNSNLTADGLTLGDKNNLLVQLGSVMSFNLNVVSVFGLNFAASLQTSIEENSTKVFADTTLHGVSGKQISFQNTNTYRYRDNNLDPVTGEPIYSGVTKEIVSGITLDILGWVSGDGMITSNVTATVSRQGTDLSSSTGNPPPTSEKVVTTEVCCKSGEPVVLSGLIQNTQTVEKKRTPFFSRIPLVGLLFTGMEKTKENTQMVIYLVPHLEGSRQLLPENTCDEEWAKNKVNKLIKRGM